MNNAYPLYKIGRTRDIWFTGCLYVGIAYITSRRICHWTKNFLPNYQIDQVYQARVDADDNAGFCSWRTSDNFKCQKNINSKGLTLNKISILNL